MEHSRGQAAGAAKTKQNILVGGLGRQRRKPNQRQDTWESSNARAQMSEPGSGVHQVGDSQTNGNMGGGGKDGGGVG